MATEQTATREETSSSQSGKSRPKYRPCVRTKGKHVFERLKRNKFDKCLYCGEPRFALIDREAVTPAPGFPESATYRVYITRNGTELKAGSVTKKPGGWQFIPNFQASPSRKLWPTADAAVRGRLKNYRLEEVHVVGSQHGATDLVVKR
jgi:hypothetical protein